MKMISEPPSGYRLMFRYTSDRYGTHLCNKLNAHDLISVARQISFLQINGSYVLSRLPHFCTLPLDHRMEIPLHKTLQYAGGSPSDIC